MKLIVTMNQIGYFKPETTARRLKDYYYQKEGNPVVFLGYLRLIRLLSELTERVAPLRSELYSIEVREIFLNTDWEQQPYLVLFLQEFREFFTESEWHNLRQRYQRLFPFLEEFVARLWLDYVHLVTLASIDWCAVPDVLPYNTSIRRSP
ncbi:hypothetical protein [Enterococcus diestrammenae]|uniref:Uncharacterized protein n=1 Tax=Enterococcus diestrammenae TaxID=1155073 RepID=A0ABV0F5M8_9ENTE|nr:hypothetical protein [Enterococcus diestrammenae]KAF1297728.1 hypothetical protein BAU18_12580 [Enterococcus diestrammenae]